MKGMLRRKELPLSTFNLFKEICSNLNFPSFQPMGNSTPVIPFQKINTRQTSLLNYCVNSRVLICRVFGRVLLSLALLLFLYTLTLGHKPMGRTSVSGKEERRLVGTKGKKDCSSLDNGLEITH